MPTFLSDGLTLAYVDEGHGEPILLIHGFASNRDVNWRYPGWIDTLTKAGRRVIAIDNRGHGESEKPHEPLRYRVAAMAHDAFSLIRHLGLGRVDVMGYSMGARISAFLALEHPEVVRSVVLAGLGMGLVDGTGPWEPIVAALEAPSASDIRHKTGLMFRRFAEQTGGDLAALAACMRASRETMPADRVMRITAPALVAVGTRDVIAGSAQGLADLLPNGRALDIPDRDHMLAVGDKAFKAGVLAFLDARP